MTTAYYFTSAEPPDPARDAMAKEATLLAAEYPGPRTFLDVGGSARSRLPVSWRIARPRRIVEDLDGRVDVHHLFTDDLRWCRLFERCTRPYLVSLTTRIPRPLPRPPRRRPFGVAVRLQDERALLLHGGWENVRCVPAGVRLPAGVAAPPPAPPWSILFASAPWTRRQFRTKGVDAVLDAVARRDDWRLVMLWRGVLEKDVRRRIEARGLAKRVEVVTERVELEPILARCHAAVLCPSGPRVVTPHPHSLLEALAAGRPVVLGRALGLAAAVERAGAGLVVDGVSGASLATALDELFASYVSYRERARGTDWMPWGARAYLASFRTLRSGLPEPSEPETASSTASRNDRQP